jgi:Domain of unknown function (DUF4439)
MGSGSTEAPVDLGTENAALQEVLAALHAAVWGYGVVGDGLPESGRAPARAGEAAGRDLRDRVAELLDSRKVAPVGAQAGYALPFPVLSAHDAASLAVRLEDGVSRAWVQLIGRAAQQSTRTVAVESLSAAELRAVAWRGAAGQHPVTSAFPGLPTG